MMVDTGAEASLISDRIYRRIGKPPLLSSSVRLSGIIGTEHTTSLGGLPLQVRLSNGRTFSHTFHVAPNLYCGLLLGYPAFRALHLLFGLIVHPSLISDPSFSDQPFFLSSATTIKPRSLAFVKVVIPAYHSEFVPTRTMMDLHFPSVIFHLPGCQQDQSDSPFPSFLQWASIPVLNLGLSSHRLTNKMAIGVLRDLRSNPVVDVVDVSDLTTISSLSLSSSSSPSSGAIAAHNEDEDESTRLLSEYLPEPSLSSQTDQILSQQVLEKLAHLPPSQQKCMHAMLMRHLPVLRESAIPASLPPVILPTKHSLPLHATPYKLSPPMQRVMRDLLDPMLRDGIIKPTISDITSPVVLVKKKDGSFRFCVDFRRFNQRLVQDQYPLPLINDIHSSLGGSKFFTTVDLKSGYWQIPLHEADKHKTAFVVPFGTYQFEVLPFGLSTAPAIFQRTLDLVLSGIKSEFVLVYIDDLIVYSATFSLHVKHVDVVFSRLQQYNLRVGLIKCSFVQSSVTFLGHTVSADGIVPDSSHLNIIRDCPTPTSTHSVKSFIALCSYYRSHILHFAEMVEPLLVLLRDNTPFVWSSACEQAFRELKQALTTAPVLAYPDYTRPFILCTDASQVAIGAVLEQVGTSGFRHPVAYFSRTLNVTQRKYTVSEKECLALVEAIRHFRQFLTFGHFLVYTDHKALQALVNPKSKVAEGRLQRWQLFLQSYDFTVYHRSGPLNVVADSLSRLHGQPPTISDYSSPPAFSFPVAKSAGVLQISAISVEEGPSFLQRLRTTQQHDIDLIPLIRFLKEGTLPSDSVLARKVLTTSSSHSLRDDILMHRAFSSGTSS